MNSTVQWRAAIRWQKNDIIIITTISKIIIVIIIINPTQLHSGEWRSGEATWWSLAIIIIITIIMTITITVPMTNIFCYVDDFMINIPMTIIKTNIIIIPMTIIMTNIMTNF